MACFESIYAFNPTVYPHPGVTCHYARPICHQCCTLKTKLSGVNCDHFYYKCLKCASYDCEMCLANASDEINTASLASLKETCKNSFCNNKMDSPDLNEYFYRKSCYKDKSNATLESKPVPTPTYDKLKLTKKLFSDRIINSKELVSNNQIQPKRKSMEEIKRKASADKCVCRKNNIAEKQLAVKRDCITPEKSCLDISMMGKQYRKKPPCPSESQCGTGKPVFPQSKDKNGICLPKYLDQCCNSTKFEKSLDMSKEKHVFRFEKHYPKKEKSHITREKWKNTCLLDSDSLMDKKPRFSADHTHRNDNSANLSNVASPPKDNRETSKFRKSKHKNVENDTTPKPGHVHIFPGNSNFKKQDLKEYQNDVVNSEYLGTIPKKRFTKLENHSDSNDQMEKKSCKECFSPCKDDGRNDKATKIKCKDLRKRKVKIRINDVKYEAITK